MSEIILPEPPPPPPPSEPPKPDTPDRARLFAWYVDGTDARWQRVEVGLVTPPRGGSTRPDRLRLTLPDGTRKDWRLEDLRVLRDQAGGAKSSIVLRLSEHQPGHSTERLMLRGGAEIVAHIRRIAPPNLDRRPPVENLGRLVKWSLAAVGSVALIIFALVPVLAAQLAMLLPPDGGEKALGDATLNQIRVALNEVGTTPPLPACSTPPEGGMRPCRRCARG